MMENKYLEGVKKFNDAQANARAVELDKLVRARNATSETAQEALATLGRAKVELEKIDAALERLGAKEIGYVPPEPQALYPGFSETPLEPRAERHAKVAEGPLPEQPPLTPAEEKRARAETEEFIILVRKALQVNGGSIRSYLIHEVTALVDDLAEGRFVVTHDSVRAALGVLHTRKIVRWVKNGRVILARKR